MTSAIARFRAFKDNLRGWGDVSIAGFRRLETLRGQKTWAPADAKAVRELVDAGGAYALDRLYRGRYAAVLLAAVIKEAGTTADPLPTRGSFETQLASLGANCVRAGWTEELYISFQNYLDSDKQPADLKDTAPGASTSENKAAVTPPEHDEAAERYRKGCFAYKKLVQEALQRWAASAAEAAQ